MDGSSEDSKAKNNWKKTLHTVSVLVLRVSMGAKQKHVCEYRMFV